MADSGYQVPAIDAGAYKIPLAGSAGTIALAYIPVIDFTIFPDLPTTTVIGRVAAGTGDPTALNATQLTTIPNAFTSGANNPGLKGLVPAPLLANVNNVLRGDGTWGVPPGVLRTCSFSYITSDAAGSTGTDNTAATLKTIVVPANTLTQVGDRLRIRCYWRADTGAAIVGAGLLNGVTIGNTTSGAGAALEVNESYVHYIDATHANIIEDEIGALGALSAVNVAGFNWAADQDFTFTQDAVVNNRIFLYEVIFDVLPKGV